MLRFKFNVVSHTRPLFAECQREPKRFSRFWEKVAPPVFGCRPKSSERPHP